VTDRPFLSLLTTVRSGVGVLPSLMSLLDQKDGAWQWCIVVASGIAPGTFREIRDLVRAEPRVQLINGAHLATNDLLGAVADLAAGEYLAHFAQGARLDPDTVGVVRLALDRADWAYTDESTEGVGGNASGVWLKPDYSPELLRSQPYALHLAAVPAVLVDRVGGFSRKSEAPWYDLVLRVSEVSGPPAHVAGPYYVRPALALGLPAGQYADAPYLDDSAEARCRAVADHCARVGIAVDDIEPVSVAGRPVGQRLHRRTGRSPRVSVIIPTIGGSSLTHGFPRCHVAELVDQLSKTGGYPDLEVIVVHDEGTPPGVLEQIEKVTDGKWVSVPFHGPFHFSRKCNAGALVASGEYLCFLNDDMDVLDPGWLGELVTLLEDPSVGAVGPRLLFADGTLQHAGHVYNGSPGHLLFGEDAQTLDFGGWSQVTGERSGVTGACLLMRAAVFAELGGFSELFPLNFNDVDLCLKIRATGLRILYHPFAMLYHYESQTRVAEVATIELTRIERRWQFELETDPYWNKVLRPALPSLSIDLRP
jgi:GT2 family glycosyltransferase